MYLVPGYVGKIQDECKSVVVTEDGQFRDLLHTMVRLLAHAAAPVVYQPHVESRCNAVSLSAQILPESEWRPRAEAHVMRVRDLLAPGFVSAPESERESGRESEREPAREDAEVLAA